MILDKFKLDGKTALITGANQGIGKAYAIALAEAGADIIGVSYAEDFRETAEAIKKIGRKFSSYVCDFSDRTSLYKFITGVKTDSPKIDILVNNAGTILRAPAAEHADEYWDKVIEVNLNAQFILTREIGKGMIERGYGKIVFIASLLSFQGGINVPGYAASKGGVKQLTMAFANEWASKGITVNAIAPGYIATDNTAALRADEARSKAILNRIPHGRWGETEDLKGPVVFLASDASQYVNGHVLVVDGGWMAR
ncbi:MAG: 2-deoxy-D-gluconate 3-dehydrogenase [Ignavibacteria bacterium CG22_combo_CG10-13_8_21_14_all_37_15]|nr:2-dehydro-3-deoxy-D-gluconate 5-dehydrogenase KduD [Ignavibacteria bacterium]PIP76508.1 MAG: 2-deoxy-D-gluconate 3-dehydrogenase [Ignavibacteria bacterium CG22_combo_CG10-13_8_21_14_all_37_15]PJC59016.1 MAG: 2-deoxy-D-gluconate 3-dehydrogenase [Ignavibacteria bacterium CG_4_9_14_0_2_um_filter_37_13]